MPASLQSRVPIAAAGTTLVDWLAARFTYFDAEGWRTQIAAGRVACNGTPVNAHHRLLAGDLVAYHPPAAATRTDAPITILHDDADLVAVDKPPHLVAHRDGAFQQNTFLHELEQRVHATQPLHLVHRLDRQTSGVLLLARHPDAVRAVQQQFTNGTAVKEYLAVVRGCVTGTTLSIDAPIGPAEHSTIAARRAVCASTARGARAARTEVTVIERLAAHTLLRVRPLTGRTHQIRVHLEHIGHPIEGDVLYGQSDERYLAWVQQVKAGGEPWRSGQQPAARHLLHAVRLAIVQPVNGAPLVLTAPEPADMVAFLEGARGVHGPTGGAVEARWSGP